MKKFHIAISTDKIAATIADYSTRLGREPCVVVPDEYALWRTEQLNFSVRQDNTHSPGHLRHLGWEDAAVTEFTQDRDVNGVVWEHFNAQNQMNEIRATWPDVDSTGSTKPVESSQ
jgi:hypothetical protein